MALNAYLPTMLQASPQIKTQPLLSDPLSVIMDTLGSPALFYHVAEFISYPALANLAAAKAGSPQLKKSHGASDLKHAA